MGLIEPGTLGHIAVLSMHPLYDTRIYNHLQTLVEAGHEVTYINWSNAGQPLGPELLKHIKLVHVERSPVMGRNPLRYARLLTWFFREAIKTGADVLHVHDPLVLPLFPLLRALRGPRVVFDIHEHYERVPGAHGMFYRACYRTCLPFAAGVVATSPSQLPPLRKPSAVVPNFQSHRAFEPHQSDDSSRAEVRVVYFGSLYSEDRDVATMLRAAESVLEQRADVVFKFGGPLHGSDSEQLRQRFENLARRFGPRFRWFGVMPRALVLRESAGADIGLWILNPSSMNLRGCSPNKIYEYLTIGAAIVATDGFGDSAAVRDACAGVLVPAGIAAATLARTLDELAGDRRRLGAMKAASRELGQRYSWEAVAPRYLELYESVRR